MFYYVLFSLTLIFTNDVILLKPLHLLLFSLIFYNVDNRFMGLLVLMGLVRIQF